MLMFARSPWHDSNLLFSALSPDWREKWVRCSLSLERVAEKLWSWNCDTHTDLRNTVASSSLDIHTLLSEVALRVIWGILKISCAIHNSCARNSHRSQVFRMVLLKRRCYLMASVDLFLHAFFSSLLLLFNACLMTFRVCKCLHSAWYQPHYVLTQASLVICY